MGGKGNVRPGYGFHSTKKKGRWFFFPPRPPVVFFIFQSHIGKMPLVFIGLFLLVVIVGGFLWYQNNATTAKSETTKTVSNGTPTDPASSSVVTVPVLQSTRISMEETLPAVFGLAKLLTVTKTGLLNIRLRSDSDGVGKGTAAWVLPELPQGKFKTQMSCSYCVAPRTATGRAYGDALALVLFAKHATPETSDGVWVKFNELDNTCDVRWNGTLIAPAVSVNLAGATGPISVCAVISTTPTADCLAPQVKVVLNGTTIINYQCMPREVVFTGKYMCICAWSRDATDTFCVTSGEISTQML